jgi:hypothetical protein
VSNSPLKSYVYEVGKGFKKEDLKKDLKNLMTHLWKTLLLDADRMSPLSGSTSKSSWRFAPSMVAPALRQAGFAVTPVCLRPSESSSLSFQ